MSAARGYLDAGGAGPVLMVTADADPPYQRPPLSKDVLAGESPAEGQPIGKGLPDGVQLRLNTTVTEVDLTSHIAHLRRNAAAGAQDTAEDDGAPSGDDAADAVAFHRLVVTTGARPNPLPTAEDGPQAERLGQDASERLTAWLKDAGVELRTGATVTRIEAPRTVHLDDGSTLSPDLVLAAVGVTPAGT